MLARVYSSYRYTLATTYTYIDSPIYLSKKSQEINQVDINRSFVKEVPSAVYLDKLTYQYINNLACKKALPQDQFLLVNDLCLTNRESISKQITMQYAKGQKVAGPIHSEYL